MNEFKRRDVDYRMFKKKIPMLFRILSKEEEPKEICFRAGDTHHQIEFHTSPIGDDNPNELYVEQAVFPEWYKTKDEDAFACISARFIFGLDGRLLRFRFSKEKDEVPPDFPIRDHFIFYKKNNLVYPEPFFKSLDMMMVELI